MPFAATKLNKKMTESPKRRCHLFILTLKEQFSLIFYTLATCNVQTQAVRKVLSSANIHWNSFKVCIA